MFYLRAWLNVVYTYNLDERIKTRLDKYIFKLLYTYTTYISKGLTRKLHKIQLCCEIHINYRPKIISFILYLEITWNILECYSK